MEYDSVPSEGVSCPILERDFIGIMRQDLTQRGVTETRTPKEVDAALGPNTAVLY